jgi:RNA 2',3'-cyclic 3'-phosphodiesterase
MFVALVPPVDLVAQLTERVRAASTDGATTDPLAGIRWTPSSNWHVTLAFLATVPEETLENASAELTNVAGDFGAFDLRVVGAGAFPRASRAGVVWAGVVGGSDDAQRALARLAKHVRIGLRRARLHPDRAAFAPHLTLARLRPAADATRLVTRLASCLPAPASSASLPPWPVTEFEVLESLAGAGPGGAPAYVQVARFHLGR